jgi:hypothetical protein
MAPQVLAAALRDEAEGAGRTAAEAVAAPRFGMKA